MKIALLLGLFALPAMAENSPVFENGDWVIKTQNGLVIRSDGGGNIHDYADMIEGLRKSNGTVRIEGVCKSSCTMFLSLPGTCVSSGAFFGFHGPRSDDQSINNLLRLVNEIADHYPPTIAKEFRVDWGMSRDFTWLTGAELLAIEPSLKPCDEKPRAPVERKPTTHEEQS